MKRILILGAVILTAGILHTFTQDRNKVSKDILVQSIGSDDKPAYLVLMKDSLSPQKSIARVLETMQLAENEWRKRSTKIDGFLSKLDAPENYTDDYLLWHIEFFPAGKEHYMVADYVGNKSYGEWYMSNCYTGLYRPMGNAFFWGGGEYFYKRYPSETLERLGFL